MSLSARRGTTLAELIVALVLGAIVVALCATTMAGQRRSERAITAAAAPAAAADEALRVLVSSFARISASDSVQFRTDSALEWFATIGVALSCFASGDSIVVPDAGSSAWWEAFPDTADAADIATADGLWTRDQIIAVRTRAGGGACGAPHRTIVLRTARAVTDTPVVRAMRRTRLMLYRGGEGSWWLGQRTCGYTAPATCTSAQPVAGPLAPPHAGIVLVPDSTGWLRAISISVGAGSARRTGRAVLWR